MTDRTREDSDRRLPGHITGRESSRTTSAARGRDLLCLRATHGTTRGPGPRPTGAGLPRPRRPGAQLFLLPPAARWASQPRDVILRLQFPKQIQDKCLPRGVNFSVKGFKALPVLGIRPSSSLSW